MLSTQSRRLFGRRVIYTEVEEINEGNILEVLEKAYQQHTINEFEIDYLYKYYKGDQPILSRVKEVRPEICNKIVENRALEIVDFKTGYLLGEPIQYVSNEESKETKDQVAKLNRYLKSECKENRDTELAEAWHICGTSYRMILPDKYANVDIDEAPFEIFTLDPRYTFIVYSKGLGNKPMMGVRFIKKDDGTVVYSCYTDNAYYEIENSQKILAVESQIFGIPIIEYPANNSRMGAFEPVISLLDAINTTASNRIDGIEQFIQALLLFHNVDITAEDFEQLKQLGGIKFKDLDPGLKGEITYLISQLDQTNTQTVVDHMYDTVLTICGMPNRNGGSSTSDTGQAVIYRDGWTAAETRAQRNEQVFKEPEMQFLKKLILICNDLSGLNLKLSTIDIRFTRKNYSNLSEKVNVLVTMLNCDKIAPLLAFSYCGLFPDGLLAYEMSLPYIEAAKQKSQEVTPDGNGTETQNDPDTGSGSGD